MSSTPRWQALLQEPLLHFVLLGALVFGADRLISGKQDDPNLITLSAEIDNGLRETYRVARGTEPDAQQMKALRQRWIDNEVLHREGLAMNLDKGDPTIRDRVIFKALNVMQANLELPKVDDATLRAWFEKNRARYDEPPRLDFQEAVLSGDAGSAVVQGFIKALNSGGPSEATSGLRIFKGRPRANVVESFGAEFIAALEAQPLHQWAALPSKTGLRVVRLEGTSAGVAARFEDVKPKVVQDWTDSTMQDLRTAAVRQLGLKYRVRLDGVGAAEPGSKP